MTDEQNLPASKISRSISQDFRGHVLNLYQLAFKDDPRRREGGNWATHYAIPAYISAAASIESFINECFLSDLAKAGTYQSPIWELDSDEFDKIQKMEVATKAILLPKLAFGKSLDKDKNPYQDMRVLFRLRNALIHYQFSTEEESIDKIVHQLSNRKIAFPNPPWPATAWLDRVSCTEGIRWAYNTAIDTKVALTELMPDGHFMTSMVSNVAKLGPDDWKSLVPER